LNIIAEPAAIYTKRSFFSETRKKTLCVQSVKVQMWKNLRQHPVCFREFPISAVWQKTPIETDDPKAAVCRASVEYNTPAINNLKTYPDTGFCRNDAITQTPE
jgi:hypothetical protein